VVLISTGLIGLAFNINSNSKPNQNQTTLMDSAIESDINKLAPLFENQFEGLTRARNESFRPHPDIEGPIPQKGDSYKVTPKEDFINFKIYNQGNDEDNFKVEVQFGESASENSIYKKKGLNVVLHSGKYTRILQPGEYQNVTLKLTIPTSIRAYTPIPINLTATSEKDPEHPDGSAIIIFYVFIDIYKDASFLDEQLPPLYIFPDSEHSTIFKIKNTGNSGDKTIRVNVTSKPDDWKVNLDLSDISVGGLPRSTTADIGITIITPEQVGESVYEINLAAISNEEIKDEIVLPVHVLKLRMIELKCKEAQKMGNVNEIITFTINVENKGNSHETVDLSYSYLTKGMENLSWDIVFSENPIILDPYESHDMVLVVLIPPNALADPNLLTLNIQDGYLIDINGISQNDITVIANKEIEVLVNPIYDFEFSKQRDRKYLIQHQIQSIDYTIEISNKGNIWDLIDISPVSNYAWMSMPYEQRKLLPGVTEKLMMTFEPPMGLDGGEYEFTIYGKSVNDPSLVQTFELTLEIINSDLELSKIQIGAMDLEEAEVEEGETVLIRALITNVGELDYDNQTSDDKIVIKFTKGSDYLGEVVIPYLPSQRNSENNSIWVSIPWKVGIARSYTIIGKLDPYESFPETNNKNNEFVGELRVEKDHEKKVDNQTEDQGGINYIPLILFILFIIIWLDLSKTKRSPKKK
jgi:uncharacterized membrane protein